MPKSTIAAICISLLLVVGIGATVLNKKSLAQTNSPARVSKITNATNATTQSSTAQPLTAAAVAKHNTPSDCWTIIHNNVYNLTSYINQHPGGGVIEQACGIDATTAFDTKDGRGSHSSSAQADLKMLLLGPLQN